MTDVELLEIIDSINKKLETLQKEVLRLSNRFEDHKEQTWYQLTKDALTAKQLGKKKE